MEHIAPIYFGYHRVQVNSHKSRNAMKTIGWRTPCTCGQVIETKQNNFKRHKSKVENHINGRGKK